MSKLPDGTTHRAIMITTRCRTSTLVSVFWYRVDVLVIETTELETKVQNPFYKLREELY